MSFAKWLHSKEAFSMKQRELTPLMLWALAFGCCIGWGSLIMPGTTFLPTAGTAGTAIAISLGAVIMILIAFNYHFVMQRISGVGGVFNFTRKIFCAVSLNCPAEK